MKYIKAFGALIPSLMLLLAVLPSGTALAQSLTPSAASGTVGSNLTISGTGFTPSTAGTVIFGYGSNFPVSYPVNSDGAGAFTLPITVPQVPGGAYTIRAAVGTTAITSFTVTPSMVLTPNSGYVNETLNIIGTGFTANATVNIVYGGASFIGTVTDATGKFNVLFTIPRSHGTHTMLASDGTLSASSYFSILPLINVSPASGQVGSTTNVTGSGFSPSARIIVSLESNENTYAATDNDGYFTVSLTIPPSTGGTHTIIATDGAATDTVPFTVQPRIVLSRDSGAIGDSVTVEGTGFGYNAEATITMDDTTLTRIAADGVGSFSVSVLLPATSGGAHLIKASDGIFSSSKSFTILSRVNIEPSSGRVGSQMTVFGTGFSPAKSVTVSFDGTMLTTVSTDASGNFVAEAVVPVSSAGKHIVSASDGTVTANSVFSTKASMSLSANNGLMGAPITISGTGFTAGSNVEIQMVGKIIKKLAVDAKGSFNGQFAVPQLDKGTYYVYCSDGTDSVSELFTIKASFSISPVQGDVGSSVQVKGTGFKGTVSINYDESIVATTTAKEDGSFSTTFIVPVSTRGAHIISVNDANFDLQLTFTVTTSFSVSTTLGYVGSEVTVSGTGFSGTVNIKYDDSVVATTTAKEDGSFSVTFTVPVSIHGDHIISISDSSNQIQTTFTVDSTPPPAPALSQPGTKARQSPQPTLSWRPVASKSGVTYTLQIATDAGFTDLVVNKEELTATRYTVDDIERLPAVSKNTPYYWRVKAVDLAQNESEWSTPGSFYVTLLPSWMWAVIVSVSVALAVIMFWFGRRMRRKPVETGDNKNLGEC